MFRKCRQFFAIRFSLAAGKNPALEHLRLGLNHPSQKKRLKIKELEPVLLGKAVSFSGTGSGGDTNKKCDRFSRQTCSGKPELGTVQNHRDLEFGIDHNFDGNFAAAIGISQKVAAGVWKGGKPCYNLLWASLWGLSQPLARRSGPMPAVLQFAHQGLAVRSSIGTKRGIATSIFAKRSVWKGIARLYVLSSDRPQNI